MKRKQSKKTVIERIGTVFAVAVCAFVLPILAVNLILLAKSYIAPDEVPEVLGIAPMVVVTDSMKPTINGGDMVVFEKCPASEIREGDIIAFFDPTKTVKEKVITHRVLQIISDGKRTYFQTKGDANNAADTAEVPDDYLVGRYQFTVPLIGKIVLFMQTPQGMILTVVIPLLAVLLYDLIRRKVYDDRQRKEKAELMNRLQAIEEKKA